MYFQMITSILDKKSRCRFKEQFKANVIENKSLTASLDLEPNAASKSARGCNAFDQMHLLDLIARTTKSEGLAPRGSGALASRRLIVVPGRPRHLDRPQPFDRRVIDDPVDVPLGRMRLPIGLERVVRLIEQDHKSRVAARYLLRRRHELLRIGRKRCRVPRIGGKEGTDAKGQNRREYGETKARDEVHGVSV